MPEQKKQYNVKVNQDNAHGNIRNSVEVRASRLPEPSVKPNMPKVKPYQQPRNVKK